MIAFIAVIAVVMQVSFCVSRHEFCPTDIRIGWKNTPPYLFRSGDYNVTGILLKVLYNALGKCCPNKTYLIFKEISNFSFYFQQSNQDNFDMFLPLVVLDKEKRLTDSFISLANSPGSIIFDFEQRTPRNVISHALHQVAPIFLFVALVLCEIGVIYWIVEILPNKKGERRLFNKILGEVVDGILWAFLTITAVGYQNITSTRLFSRMLSGLLLVARIFLVAFSVAFLTKLIVETSSLYKFQILGKKIAVIDGSVEQKYVIDNGGYAIGFNEFDDFLNKINNGNLQIEGGHFDLQLAQYYVENNAKFHHRYVVEEDSKSYGLVLQPSTFTLKSCLEKFSADNYDEIHTAIANEVKSFKNIRPNEPETLPQRITSDLNAVKATISLSVATLILCALGFLREQVVARRKKSSSLCTTYDTMENFVILHTVKSNHQSALKDNMKKIQNDLRVLQAYFEHASESLYSKLAITDNLFRANIPIPYDLNDIGEE